METPRQSGAVISQHTPRMPSANIPRFSVIALLPHELIVAIASLLSSPDLKSFRLCSKFIAGASRQLLALKEFVGFPFRQDAQRLADLSQQPQLVSRIRSVKFYFARMDHDEIKRESVYDWGTEYHQFKHLVDQWDDYFNNQSSGEGNPHLDLDLVEPALERLINLESVYLTWTECPWKIEEVKGWFNDETSVDLAGDELFNVQRAVLDVLKKRNVPLKRLAIDPIEYRRLPLPSILDGQAKTSFGSIKQVLLGLDGKGAPEDDKLENFISLMPLLRELQLHGFRKPWTPEGGRFLPNTHLQHLESLDLLEIAFNLDHFASFLVSHSATVKRVQLRSMRGVASKRGVVPSKFTWELVFELMNQQLKCLNDVHISGLFGQSCWPFSDDQYTWISGDGIRGHHLRYGVEGSEIEKYIMEGGECPRLPWKIRGQ
ncbi:hypothetical protein EDB80DRAFT_284087 [Ilyonectria destructans]|nr:hypothetical protein EDB80DRAFT_284087 [Ilyonectria destructans]